MSYIKHALALIALVFLQACENPKSYPISGEASGPDDPVLDMTSHDTLPPT